MPITKPSDDALPRLALTLGDPSGVGPEVVAGVWANPQVHAICRPVVVGGVEVMTRAIQLRKVQACVAPAAGEELARSSPDVVPCLEPPAIGGALPGEAAYRAIDLATRLVIEGDADGVVTAPISKANLQAAGYHYPGHTELLAEKCGVSDFAMMLYLPPGPTTRCPHGLGVVHTTLHTALRSVFDLLSVDAIAAKCRLADNAMRAFGAARPRVAVAALNPHAGEEGLFGEEEQTLIRPAVERAAAEGLDVVGPLPVDTLMGRAAGGEFDAVVAMYHDQGHIALKLLGMHAAVNVTLGLPIVRTSVAHGTAPDLAWQGVAETDGMVAAIEAAARLAARQKNRTARRSG
ncbi:MAG: 4-hydroxythreonine-4-phosphate dehydrogenase PdxA [Planctomycetota bacterium]